MTVEVIKEFGNYGLLGLVLFGIGAGLFVAGRWWLTHVVKPRTEAEIAGLAASRETDKKMAEVLSALGMTSANTDRGVSSLIVSARAWDTEFTTHRRAGRVVAEALDLLANPALPADEREVRLRQLAARLHAVWDDGSRELRALTAP